MLCLLSAEPHHVLSLFLSSHSLALTIPVIPLYFTPSLFYSSPPHPPSTLLLHTSFISLWPHDPSSHPLQPQPAGFILTADPSASLQPDNGFEQQHLGEHHPSLSSAGCYLVPRCSHPQSGQQQGWGKAAVVSMHQWHLSGLLLFPRESWGCHDNCMLVELVLAWPQHLHTSVSNAWMILFPKENGFFVGTG